MKKKSFFLIIMMFVLISVLGINSVYASENNDKTANTEMEEGKETFLLEDLLNNKEEQNKTKSAASDTKLKELLEKDKQKEATLSTQTESSTNIPSSNKVLDGVDGNGYIWNVKPYNTSTKVYFAVYKYDIMKKKNTEIYKSNEADSSHYVTYCLRDDIVYILYVNNYKTSNPWLTEYPTSHIVGINIKTNKVVYTGSFNTPQDCGYLPSFAVDGNQRFYFVYKSTGTRIFDKTGKLLFDHAPLDASTGYINFFKGVSPNNKALFFEVMANTWDGYDYYQSVYEGIQKLDNNGVFVNKKDYTVYGRTFPNVYSYNPRWYFLDSAGTYAADQYGRIVKFNYNANNTIGVDREVILDLASGVEDYTFYHPEYPNVCKNGNDIYLMGSNNNIYLVNGTTFKVSKYLTTGVADYNTSGVANYGNICTMGYFENSILLCYKTWTYNIIQIKLDNSNFHGIVDKIYTDHISTTRSIQDIVNKYKQTAPKYNYNTSIYKEIPSWKNPYKAGSLKDQVVTDTLNTLNYNRWLVGVNEIGLNSNKMDRNQKGAVISKANGTISHYPKQPSDMPTDFYNEAYDGCGASGAEGDTYSGNVSYGDRIPYQAIRGFISDLNNVSTGSATGHRQSMLDPKATAISFGQCEEYTTASVYYDYNKKGDQKYYAFPSAGYFPNTEMKIGEYWSIYLNEDVMGTVSVKFTYKGKQYNGTGLLFESGYPVLSFKMPTELRKLLGNDASNIPGGTQIQVEVLGLKDKNQNNVIYKYTVNFFDMKSEIPTPQDVANLIFDYKYYADKYPDLKKAFGYDVAKLKNHWLTVGIKEGRQASPLFNPKYYIYNNSDLKKAFGTNYVSAYNHFINTGYAELRASSNEYYGKYYKGYADLKDFSAYNLMKHYITYGRNEKRKATNVADQTPTNITNYLFNPTIYYSVNRDLKNAFGTNNSKLKQHWETVGKREGRMSSLVFDAKYYIEKYSDIKKAFGNNYAKALEHFATKGVYEGRQASMYFDVKYYINTYPDIAKTFGNNYSKALEHFANIGIKEGRDGSSTFKISIYGQYQDLKNAYKTNYIQYYIHYQNVGKNENRRATDVVDNTSISITNYLFDPTIYYSVNKDLKNVFGNNSTKLNQHWENIGKKEGRMASLVFDAKYYLNKNLDLKRAFGEDYSKALEHFVTKGIYEGRQGSIYFDVKYYINTYSDVKEMFGNNYSKALEHFINYGMKAGRDGSNTFKISVYGQYQDLKNAFKTNYLQYYIHYQNVGKNENRKIS